jgi:hypothetical protein
MLTAIFQSRCASLSLLKKSPRSLNNAASKPLHCAGSYSAQCACMWQVNRTGNSMGGFSSSFLLLFYQISLGGLFGLAFTPFHELDRAFYKSTGGVLLVIATLGFWGKTNLYLETFTTSFSWVVALEATAHLFFVIFFACYFVSLWGERQALRAKSFAACILTGLAGLFLSAHSFYQAPIASIETFVYPIAFFLSSLLLGSVTVGMLIGHWYLIDTGQTLDPFVRIYRFFVTSLVSQSIFLVSSFTMLYFLGSQHTLAELEKISTHHSTLMITRIVIGYLAPLVLSWMIWRTLLIPHTMAATGLFYIALLGVFVGEILGRQILALTSLPF